MTTVSETWPADLRFSFDAQPDAAVRSSLGQRINEFHARTVPLETQRFGLLLHDAAGWLAAGLCGALSWQWLFVEVLWVSDARRGQGIGRGLLAAAEAHAVAAGCHSAWLDSFQAKEFYLGLGYEVFGDLPDYPPGQSRWFLRKRLMAEPFIRREPPRNP